ncbi:MAG: DsrE family protein [Proteobacteria bacterium]|nr:DsrE family protein [Pseudomonadota bacterium]
MKKLLSALFLMFGLMSQVFAAGGHKVVYHVDYADPARFSATITSINNMIDAYEQEMADYDIRIVFVAGGARFVTDDKLSKTPFAEDAAFAKKRTELKERLLSLNSSRGVKLFVCNNTLRDFGLDESKLHKGVTPVISGVVEVAALQEQGFSYIKIQ